MDEIFDGDIFKWLLAAGAAYGIYWYWNKNYAQAAIASPSVQYPNANSTQIMSLYRQQGWAVAVNGDVYNPNTKEMFNIYGKTVTTIF